MITIKYAKHVSLEKQFKNAAYLTQSKADLKFCLHIYTKGAKLSAVWSQI